MDTRETDADWLAAAFATAPEEDEIVVDGCRIHRLAWGEEGRPGIVLVHGGAAHAHWWCHVAPLLGPYRVVAPDLSGNGDSGRRDSYSIHAWAEEVLAVSEGVGIVGKPVVVGHSMGGFVGAATAVRGADRIAGLIIVDSPMVSEDPEVEAARLGRAFGRPKVYPDVEAALGRFRTVPPQDYYIPAVLDHVARHSLRRVDGGWSWKFDPEMFRAVRRSVAAELLPSIRCRVALLRSERGLVTPEIGAVMYERLGRVAPVVEIPQAGHHVMLDQPLLLVTAIRALLADWEHSVPVQRG
ncbi:MAG: alpha/beta hydrolase [Acidimicrobiales bacterium]|nr:MAG: alpha/beta hydrolase [Acidimicrobiales bacterium]